MTHPVGESVGVTTLQELLKDSGKAGNVVNRVLGPMSIAWDVLGDPKDAW